MQLDILETHNLWIIKPGAKSRGRGITVMGKLLEILKAYVSNGEPNLQKDSRWIIQKYIWTGEAKAKGEKLSLDEKIPFPGPPGPLPPKNDPY